jgi:V8-like Glu-specific endopeptidase
MTAGIICAVLLIATALVRAADSRDDMISTPGDIFGTDERHPSQDAAVGRILDAQNGACTGWLTSFGAVLTAGHCATHMPLPLRFQFNVPLSMPNGYVVDPANPADTYPFVFIAHRDNGEGDDWAVARADQSQGMTPGQRQRSFVRLFNLDVAPNVTQLRVTGYGVDGPPPDYGRGAAPRNKFNKTQQTATGPFIGAGGAANSVCYVVDTNPSNSGSPVYINGTTVAMAIHTRGNIPGACAQAANSGTSIANPGLVAAMQAFPGSLRAPVIPPERTLFVDEGSVVNAQDGTVLAPFQSLRAALMEANNKAGPTLLTLAPGFYADLSMNFKPANDTTIVLPVGDATFYPNLQ